MNRLDDSSILAKTLVLRGYETLYKLPEPFHSMP